MRSLYFNKAGHSDTRASLGSPGLTTQEQPLSAQLPAAEPAGCQAPSDRVQFNRLVWRGKVLLQPRSL